MHEHRRVGTGHVDLAEVTGTPPADRFLETNRRRSDPMTQHRGCCRLRPIRLSWSVLVANRLPSPSPEHDGSGTYRCRNDIGFGELDRFVALCVADLGQLGRASRGLAACEPVKVNPAPSLSPAV